MERADIAKLWQLEEIAAAGHHELAANLRTAINELVKARAAPKWRTDLEALETFAANISEAGNSKRAEQVRTAIAEIRDLRQALTGRTVSCEACNGMQPVYDAALVWFRSEYHYGPEWSAFLKACNVADAARRATDENGGVGA